MNNKDKVRFLHPTEKDIPEFYADAVQIKMAPFGFKLSFGLLGDSPSDEEDVCHVRVSPQMAKVFSRLLARQVDLYEENVGDIALPDGLLRDLNL